MLAASADMKVVQETLGHSSVVLTANTYTSVSRGLSYHAAEAVAVIGPARNAIRDAAQTAPSTSLRRLRVRAYVVTRVRSISRPQQCYPARLSLSARTASIASEHDQQRPFRSLRRAEARRAKR